MKKIKLEVPCYVAEFLGTFAIVLFGCGSIAVLPEGPAKHLSANLAFGLAVAAMIYALGHVSKAHFNPAVTIGFIVAKRFPLRSGLAYVAAQCLGAILASAVLALLFPTGNLGATTPSIPLVQAGLVEALLTFFLVFVIGGAATDRRANPGLAGAAIGATVFICGLFAGSLTGNSLNPARSLGPALFQPAALGSLWLYFVGPIVGGVCATLTYRWMASGNQSAADLGGCC